MRSYGRSGRPRRRPRPRRNATRQSGSCCHSASHRVPCAADDGARFSPVSQPQSPRAWYRRRHGTRRWGGGTSRRTDGYRHRPYEAGCGAATCVAAERFVGQNDAHDRGGQFIERGKCRRDCRRPAAVVPTRIEVASTSAGPASRAQPSAARAIASLGQAARHWPREICQAPSPWISPTQSPRETSPPPGVELRLRGLQATKVAGKHRYHGWYVHAATFARCNPHLEPSSLLPHSSGGAIPLVQIRQ